MNPTGKAGKPRARPPHLKGATQFQRFVETAKALDADDGSLQFMRAMDVLAPPITPTSKKKEAPVKEPPSLTKTPRTAKIARTAKAS
jgi:hypothetical protein